MAAIASLTVRISAQIAELQTAFAEAKKSTDKFADSFEGIATRAAAVGTFFGTLAADIAGSIARGIGGAIKDAIRLSTEFSNAFLGLSSTARAFGSSTEAATAAARGLSSDGMLPLKDSVTGLKNLLASGFNLEQSTRLMEAFKDSAAFGRSGALSFGDAVRSATEGVKNQNSTLVDNAGVTKNLSVILGEAGFKLQDLSDKTKGASARQALYLGILRETAAQQGDAAKAAQTYSGQLTAMQTAYESLLATWGDAITRNRSVMEVLKAVGELFRWLTDRLADNGNGYKAVSDILGFFVTVLAGVVRALDVLQQSFNALDTGIRSNVKGIAEAVSDIGKLLIQVLNLASKVPGASAAFGIAADEIRSLLIVQDAASRIAKEQGAVIAENTRRGAEWSANLQGLAGKMDGLAQRIKDTRGQTVDLGEASTKTAGKQDALGDAADKAGTKAAKAAERARLAFLKWARESEETFYKIKKLGDDAIWDRLQDRFSLLNLTLHDTLPDAIFQIQLALGKLVPVVTGIDNIIKDLPIADLTPKKGPFDDIVADILKQVTPVKDAFREIFADLPKVIVGALQSGQSVIAATAGVLGQHFTAAFQKGIARQAGGGKALTGGEKAMGVAGVGIEAAFTGYGFGEALGTKTKGTLGGAAAGAAAGLPLAAVTGGLSVAVGAGIGAIAGFFGGRSAEKKAKEQLAANKKALADQYGGMENLRKLADKLGVNIQKAFDAKKPEQFEAAVNSLNKAIEAHNKRLEGLQKAMDGVNARAQIFGKQFAEAFEQGDTAKLAEIAQRTQPEFERIGIMVRDTFAGLVKESGSAIKAIRDMEPAFSVLESGVSDFGLTSTAVIDELLTNFRLVTDEGLAPFFEAIEANGQVLQGLVDAKALSPEGFQAIATDIGQSLQSIVEKGGDVSRTLALSQPVLQTLWEAQERYGAVTDDTTQSLLRQAEEQGLVGAQMKDVNERILDVLLAIGKVLGADLPQAFKKLKTPAKEAADDIEGAFNSIEINELEIQYRYQALNELPVAATNVPGGEGVTPVVASAELGVNGNTYVTDVYLDGDRIARSTARHMPTELRRMGVGV